MAMGLYSLLTWTAADVLCNRHVSLPFGAVSALRQVSPYAAMAMAIVAVTVGSGGFVAGNDAVSGVIF